MISQRFSRVLATMLIAVSAAGMLAVSFDAEARRMGGGKSLGRQSSNVTQQRQAVTPPAAANTAQRSAAPAAGAAAAGTAAKSGMSRFLGPLAGIAAGLGIAALLSSMGLGGAMLEFLSSAILIGIVVFGVMFLIRRLRGAGSRTATQGAGNVNNQYRQSNDPGMQPQYPRAAQPAPAAPVSAAPAAAAYAAPEQTEVDPSWFIPADFDITSFLANSKQRFVEIQALWDKGDVNALREYLTDDLLIEATPQIQQRESDDSSTEVVLLNAELLGIEKVAGGHLASIRYSGMLREGQGTEAFRFEEVWNLYKEDNAGWLVAGIQQLTVND
jgi:predicted lipid-binding transport protein (Tim44 family)